jgi:hypothetical protein
MTVPEYARLAARALARGDGEEREPPAPSAENRARMIGAVEAALRAKRARLLWRRGAYAALAVAAAVGAVGVGVRAWRAPSAVVAAVGPTKNLGVSAPGSPAAQAASSALADGLADASQPPLASLEDGEALAPGSHIVARRRGHALLAFATGTRLTVEDGGDLTLVDGGPDSVVSLAHGALRADVPELAAGASLRVRTSDAEVEVRGTSFRVAADEAPCEGAATRVEVYEGTVTIRHAGAEERVEAGSSWPRGCVAVSARASSLAGAATRGRAPSAAATAKAPAVSASSLVEQNDLFAAALASKQAGDVGAAIERFAAFTSRYPASPLAESAAAHRMKLLRGVDPARATAAARAYLARWPDGFARSEAEGILAGAR